MSLIQKSQVLEKTLTLLNYHEVDIPIHYIETKQALLNQISYFKSEYYLTNRYYELTTGDRTRYILDLEKYQNAISILETTYNILYGEENDN